jgi:tRNA (cmo5U34)-methyltransferase
MSGSPPSPFSVPESVARYAEGPVRQVPGFHGLQRMTGLLLAERIRDDIDSAPVGPFDGATCLLTLHFLPEDERRRTLAEVHRRLRTGAPFVVAHHSFPQEDGEKAKWLARYAAFATASGVPGMNAEKVIAAIGDRLPVLSPEQDEALLRDAGFAGVALFYAGFTFRGWVAYKA